MSGARSVATAARAALCLCLSVPAARAAPGASSPAAAVAASNRFGFELYARIKDRGENVICSPVSASCCSKRS
jgi:serine protease inhibitor